MTLNWRYLAKGSVQVMLFVILSKYFVLPSWKRFREEKTVVTSAEKDLGGIPAPMVTLCPLHPDNVMGYKNNSVRLEKFPTSEIVSEVCKGLKGEDIVRCVEEKTFDLSDGLVFAIKGYLGSGGDFTDSRFWSPDFSWSANGICYQLEANTTLAIKRPTNVLWMQLKSRKSLVFIHDSNYFLQSLNPGFPLNMMLIGETMKMYSLKLVRHNNLDIASKPCNPDPLYSFTRCIKSSLSREVGCRLHWDRWTHQGLPTCHQLEQYR